MVRDVAIRNLAHKAAAGDQRALSFLLSLAGEHGPSQKVSSDAFVFDSHDLEIIEEFCKDRQATRGDRNGRK
jgi:hypothetical protein